MSQSRRRVRVVIAENHILLRELISESLGNRGNRFELAGAAESFEEASRICLKSPVDLLLLRLALVGPKNEAGLTRLRKHRPELRILQYCGSQATEEHIAKAIRMGSTGVVSMETGLDEFLRAVDRISRGQNHFCEQTTQIMLQMATGGPARAEDNRKPSARELEILRHIAEGLTSKQIADLLGLSVATVETHRRNMMAKLRAHNVADLIRYGHEHHLFGGR